MINIVIAQPDNLGYLQFNSRTLEAKRNRLAGSLTLMDSQPNRWDQNLSGFGDDANFSCKAAIEKKNTSTINPIFTFVTPFDELDHLTSSFNLNFIINLNRNKPELIFRVVSGGQSKSHPFHCVVCGSKYGSVYSRLLLPSCSEGFRVILLCLLRRNQRSLAQSSVSVFHYCAALQ